MERRFYYVKEVAALLQVSCTTVLREIADKNLPALKIRRDYRIGETDLANYMKAMKTKDEAANGVSSPNGWMST
jgi:excisionase family DNA binding protein